MKLAIFLHLIGVTIWVGGMFFAYMALRPAAVTTLEPAMRLPLWSATFARFFVWVWIAVAMIFGSGLYMLAQIGLSRAPDFIWIMFAIGTLMLLIYAHVYFAPYRRLRRHSALLEWQPASRALAQIRVLVSINLLLGLGNIAVATIGEAFFGLS